MGRLIYYVHSVDLFTAIAVGSFFVVAGCRTAYEVVYSYVDGDNWRAILYGDVSIANLGICQGLVSCALAEALSMASAMVATKSILIWEEIIGGARMKHEYHEGPRALENFNKGMSKLFQAKKAPPKEKPQPERKQDETSKG